MGCSSSSSKEPIVLDPLIMKEASDNDDWSEGKVTLGNGNVRNVMQWIPKKTATTALVIFVHGVNEHALVYDKLAHIFTKQGWACHGIDHYKHGLSATDEERGFVDNYKFLYEDLIEFVKYVRALPGNADLPLFIFCHSLGTVITTLALPKIDNVKAVIFNGAAFNPGYASASPFGFSFLFPLTLTPTSKMIARIGAANDPRGYVGYLWVEEVATNTEFIDKIKHDARTYNGVAMNKPGYELLCLIDDARAAVKNVTVPFIAFHGENDIVTFPSGSKYLIAKSGTPNHLKSIKIVPKCKHHTFHEVDSVSIPAIEKYVNYISGFMKPQDDSGVRAATATK